MTTATPTQKSPIFQGCAYHGRCGVEHKSVVCIVWSWAHRASWILLRAVQSSMLKACIDACVRAELCPCRIGCLIVGLVMCRLCVRMFAFPNKRCSALVGSLFHCLLSRVLSHSFRMRVSCLLVFVLTGCGRASEERLPPGIASAILVMDFDFVCSARCAFAGVKGCRLRVAFILCM